MAIPAGTRLTAERLAREFPLKVYAPQDTVVNNSTTLTDITGLSVSLEAGATYIFRGWTHWASNPDADIRFGWTIPSGADGRWTAYAPDFFQAPIVGAERINYIEAAAVPLGITLRAAGDDTDPDGIWICCLPAGWVTTGEAGVMTMRFRQDTARSSNTIVKAYSWLEFTRVA